ncbi:MAG: serine/threonine protein kinase, partial [Kofleriaceae bacterium]|nr:serine/threonine protein kinase [Kofleriaceae bacterium]
MNAGVLIDQRFELEKELRGGGMGRIFRAKDRHTGATVAVKVANESGGDTAQRFRRESVLLAEIAHPAIVAYVAHGELPDRTPYLVMEWLAGSDLGDILEHQTARQETVRLSPQALASSAQSDDLAGGSLDIATVLLIGKRVAAALTALHARGVVHRDIKPGNLFLPGGDPAQAKLLDFGTARERMPAHPLTSEGMIVGTPYYMAPEQVREGGTIGPASDVWAVGCVLYECLSGRAPFSAPHPLAALARIMLDEPTLVSELRPDVPEDLARLVHEMLTKDAARRPADGAELLARLESISPVGSTVQRVAAAAPSRPSQRRLTGPESRV